MIDHKVEYPWDGGAKYINSIIIIVIHYYYTAAHKTVYSCFIACIHISLPQANLPSAMCGPFLSLHGHLIRQLANGRKRGRRDWLSQSSLYKRKDFYNIVHSNKHHISLVD